VGVALFAFLFGTFFYLADYISMWWGVTQAIFTGGAGAAIIGGLYWKKGTAAGAWAGFVTGSSLTVAGIIAQQIAAFHNTSFFLNGTQIGFFSSLLAVAMYVGWSLATYHEDFNIDRMLHRGRYTAISIEVGDTPIKHQPQKIGWIRFLGFDDNFTHADKWIAGSVLAWTLLWFGVFVVGTLWNLISPWSTETWVHYSYFNGITLPVFFGVIGAVWFTWGGIVDMRALFRRLRHQRINELDDGTVVNNQNLDEAN
jgi:SSS family solute:Na+ symporter